ncbi:MAG: hypothetical protein J3K34DRAFT_372388 [Monoraphidium minutum]|nr:MAG: hypothetical protein J3K34DRAFT_372388 [Monoraphidium minutum]
MDSAALDALLLVGLTFVAFSSVSNALGGAAGGLLPAGGARGLQLTKVQVGLLAVARGLKAQLDEIGAAADTSDNAGLKELLQAVSLALLRNPQYWELGAAARRGAADAADLEREFNSASLSERSKFADETLVNVRGGGGVRRRAPAPPGGGLGHPDELIVVTLLVATKGELDLPKRVDGAESLRALLRGLGGLPAEQVLGVEVLWTPQAEGDYFSRDEVTADYPDMRVL